MIKQRKPNCYIYTNFGVVTHEMLKHSRIYIHENKCNIKTRKMVRKNMFACVVKT
jgi:hypothetical protein